MKSVLVGIPFLILSIAFADSPTGAPTNRVSAQVVNKQATWEAGQYRGWIYFLAKHDVIQEYNIEDITGKGDAVAFYESHSNLACAVQGNGSGMCKAAFPMDFTLLHEVVFTLPDCTITEGLYMRGASFDVTLPGSPLASKSLGDEFAIGFEPNIWDSEGVQYASISGSDEGCKNEPFIKTFVVPYATVFPSRSLTLRVGNRTALTVEGTCSMEGLPREGEFPMGEGIVYSEIFSIVECRWMVFRIDMSAIPPEGGEE
jgi:hypothetical protein